MGGWSSQPSPGAALHAAQPHWLHPCKAAGGQRKWRAKPPQAQGIHAPAAAEGPKHPPLDAVLSAPAAAAQAFGAGDTFAVLVWGWAAALGLSVMCCGMAVALWVSDTVATHLFRHATLRSAHVRDPASVHASTCAGAHKAVAQGARGCWTPDVSHMLGDGPSDGQQLPLRPLSAEAAVPAWLVEQH